MSRAIQISGMHSEEDALTDDFRFAAVVAEFGEILAQSPFADDGDFSAVLALAESAVDEDSRADRIEFLALVALSLEVSERD